MPAPPAGRRASPARTPVSTAAAALHGKVGAAHASSNAPRYSCDGTVDRANEGCASPPPCLETDAGTIAGADAGVTRLLDDREHERREQWRSRVQKTGGYGAARGAGAGHGRLDGSLVSRPASLQRQAGGRRRRMGRRRPRLDPGGAGEVSATGAALAPPGHALTQSQPARRVWQRERPAERGG